MKIDSRYDCGIDVSDLSDDEYAVVEREKQDTQQRWEGHLYSPKAMAQR
jgi:hypothetical protein